MASAIDLADAVTSASTSGRLGVPVFVRYLLHGPEAGEPVLRSLASAATLARDWLAQDLTHITAVGSLASGQTSLTLQFRQGGTAVISYAQSPTARGVDLMILGNHGALYHEAAVWPLEPCGGEPEPALLALIERALQSGQPVAVGGSPA
jgi:hypothetical protein